MPPLEIIKLYRNLGGKIITVGSDAHSAQFVGGFIKEGYDLLKQAGFVYVTAFEKRQPRFIKI